MFETQSQAVDAALASLVSDAATAIDGLAVANLNLQAQIAELQKIIAYDQETALDFRKALRAVGWNGKLMAHVMPWLGEPGHVHRCVRYSSTDPVAVSAQCDNMQAVGISGVLFTWRGIDINGGWDQQAAVVMATECAKRGMLFAYVLDPNLLKYRKNQLTPTQEVIRQLNSATVQTVLHGGSYMPEGYVLDFLSGFAVDWTAVAAAVPGVQALMRHKGYGWPGLQDLASAAKDNLNSAMKIPGIALGFNDAGCPMPYGIKDQTLVTGRDYSQSVWSSLPDSQPARVNDPQAGNYFFDVVAGIGASQYSKAAPYAAIITWNDYDEGTAVEGLVSALTGIRVGK